MRTREQVIRHGFCALALYFAGAYIQTMLWYFVWPLGLLCVLLPQWVQHPVFDTRWTNWVGFVTRKPVTEDYVPVFPWLAAMWWGMAAGQWVLARKPLLLQGALPRGGSVVAWMGRWSLSWYMLHQPVLIGLVAAATWLVR